MLLRLQPCARSLILVLLVQTMLGVVLVEAVPATRSPGGTTSASTATPTPPICVDPTTAPTPPPATTAAPTTSLAATNTTWPRWVGPVGTPPPLPTSAPNGVPPPGGGGGGAVRDNLVEDDDGQYPKLFPHGNFVCASLISE
ncbi:hypothetical protein ONE63_006961 [Megalurothrips usitatus]|uniref:Uncharacterized protein n=1 Tax=Megalurothrips usitatus TaxID=439358 RepID=A0AAV7XUL4_9NEOP|nr:hypothetical protein ONE63_006961 [Megalurothrips usitatus]